MNTVANTKQLKTIIQISDCHLFAQSDALHLGQNVYDNLSRTLQVVAQLSDVDVVIFSGDLSQDHSAESYQNFVEIFDHTVKYYGLKSALYWLPGNHDELALLNNLLIHPLIKPEKHLVLGSWHLHLLNSKSATPSGIISTAQLNQLDKQLKLSKHNLIFMHHPPIDVGYFIDKHGLQQKSDFWQIANRHKSLKGICCGHVHRGMEFKSSAYNQAVIYTCPATSIQFDPKSPGLSALDKGPGYRRIVLADNGNIETSLHYLPNMA